MYRPSYPGVDVAWEANAPPDMPPAAFHAGVQKTIRVFRPEPAAAAESDAVALEQPGVRPAGYHAKPLHKIPQKRLGIVK